MNTAKPLVHADECYKIIGACFEVYREKGTGFLESVFHECLALEFGLQAIPFESQKRFRLVYKGLPLQQVYVADFVCFDKIVVELKAATALMDEHRAQMLNCLATTGYKLGLLVNFGHSPNSSGSAWSAEAFV